MDRRTFIGTLIGTGLAAKVFGVAERPHNDIIYSEGWGGNHELLWGKMAPMGKSRSIEFIGRGRQRVKRR